MALDRWLRKSAQVSRLCFIWSFRQRFLNRLFGDPPACVWLGNGTFRLLVNLSHKAVAATRYRHDVAVGTWRFAEDLPQFRDRLRQIVFLDDRVRPDRLHDPLLVQHTVVMLDHIKKRIEYSRRQGNWRPVQSP